MMIHMALIKVRNATYRAIKNVNELISNIQDHHQGGSKEVQRDDCKAVI